MKFHYHDGGRREAGYKGDTGDCVVRAIAIATDRAYQEVYDDINVFCKTKGGRFKGEKKSPSSSRTGIRKPITRKYMQSIGWQWVPTMHIGSGCHTHLKADELPEGRLVVQVSRHVVAVIDGVVFDNADPTRSGTRCVYGYYKKPDAATRMFPKSMQTIEDAILNALTED